MPAQAGIRCGFQIRMRARGAAVQYHSQIQL
jgi:hypothetical protein